MWALQKMTPEKSTLEIALSFERKADEWRKNLARAKRPHVVAYCRKMLKLCEDGARVARAKLNEEQNK